MIENFVEKNQTFCAMIIDVIHISTKSLTECMSREVVNFDMILLLELFESHVDPMGNVRPPLVLYRLPSWRCSQFQMARHTWG